MSSIPSSVILEQPDRDSTVKLGSEWTEKMDVKENSAVRRQILRNG